MSRGGNPPAKSAAQELGERQTDRDRHNNREFRNCNCVKRLQLQARILAGGLGKCDAAMATTWQRTGKIVDQEFFIDYLGYILKVLFK